LRNKGLKPFLSFGPALKDGAINENNYRKKSRQTDFIVWSRKK
jgi:hypothetical protein